MRAKQKTDFNNEKSYNPINCLEFNSFEYQFNDEISIQLQY